MVNRILQLIREKNLTASQFADEIGIQRSGMSHIISGRNKPSLEFVMKILNRYPDVRPEWLLYGTGEQKNSGGSLKLPDNQQEIPVTREEKPFTNDIPSLFDEPEVVENKTVNKPLPKKIRERSDRRIERIIVFYDDRTFREYEPEK